MDSKPNKYGSIDQQETEPHKPGNPFVKSNNDSHHQQSDEEKKYLQVAETSFSQAVMIPTYLLMSLITCK